jgi:hypothetical protein
MINKILPTGIAATPLFGAVLAVRGDEIITSTSRPATKGVS